MEFEFIYDPVQLIIIRNVFTKKDNEEILAEAIKNKSSFKSAKVLNGRGEDIRNNISSYYDELYSNDRTKSKLLEAINRCFKNIKISQILSSFSLPINMFINTNSHQTQVSRYGDQGQNYKYHIDHDGNRLITFVYYFHKEPKKYKGGEIQFTRSPICYGKPVDKNEELVTITPENNMMVIFGSKIPHTVLPTTSPKTFDEGRFSANIWLSVK
jgi:Rps23 Pro-64 3,4-dihydroxylase Tpa1-like proline 4-hydroxylase